MKQKFGVDHIWMDDKISIVIPKIAQHFRCSNTFSISNFIFHIHFFWDSQNTNEKKLNSYLRWSQVYQSRRVELNGSKNGIVLYQLIILNNKSITTLFISKPNFFLFLWSHLSLNFLLSACIKWKMFSKCGGKIPTKSSHSVDFFVNFFLKYRITYNSIEVMDSFLSHNFEITFQLQFKKSTVCRNTFSEKSWKFQKSK